MRPGDPVIPSLTSCDRRHSTSPVVGADDDRGARCRWPPPATSARPRPPPTSSCSSTSTACPTGRSSSATRPCSTAIPRAIACGPVRYLRRGLGRRSRAPGSTPAARRRRRGRCPTAATSGSATTTRCSGRSASASTGHVWDRLGGFDEGYRGYGAEDTDLGVPGPLARHPAGLVRRRHGVPPVAPADAARPRPHRGDRRQRPAVPRAVGPVADDGLVDRAGRPRARPLRSVRRGAAHGWSPSDDGPGAAVCSVVVGPDGHGVVRHALAVAAATDVAVRSLDRAAGAAVPSVPASADVVHLHFTDRLFGPDAAASGRVFGRAGRCAAGRRVVTLHDVPEPDRNRPCRASHRGLPPGRPTSRRTGRLQRARTPAAPPDRHRPRHVGHPVADRHPDQQPSAADRAVGTRAGRPQRRRARVHLPRQGPRRRARRRGELPDDVAVVALGQVSVGHDDLLAELRRDGPADRSAPVGQRPPGRHRRWPSP